MAVRKFLLYSNCVHAERQTNSPDPRNIANALNWWLSEEIRDADTGRNAFLSDFEPRKADFYLPFDDDRNYSTQKTRGHHTRLIDWVTHYGDFLTDDWYTGRLLFAPLMEIAGGWRMQCFFEATDAVDYWHRRHELGPSGIDMQAVTAAELGSPRTSLLVELDPEERIAHITTRTLETNDESLKLHQSVYAWAAAHPSTEGPMASPDDEPVMAMREVQTVWAGLLVAHIAVAASFRDGNYARVPFLEPKNITDVTKVIYPLRASESG